MKSILKFGIAAVLAAVMANAAFAVTPGDAFLFSTSNTDPNAGTTLSKNDGPGLTAPLYIWVTSSAAGDDITPASTVLNGNTPPGPTGAAGIAINGTVTTTTGLTIGTIQYYNPTYTTTTPSSQSINRWGAVTPAKSGGTSITNFQAATAMQSPAGTTYLPGTVTGLGRSGSGDPNYKPAVTVPNGSTGGAWLLGEITFNASAAGDSTFALTAGTQEITKSGPSTTTVLTTAYSFGTATIHIASPAIDGDATGDNKVDLADLNGVLNNFGSNNPGGDAHHDGNPTGLSDLNAVLNNFGFGTGAGSVATVPEPASIGLLAIGSVLALGFRARRRSA